MVIINAFPTSHSPIALLSLLPTILFSQLSSLIIPYSPFLFWALTSNYPMMLQFANPIDPPTCDPNIPLNPLSSIIFKTCSLVPNSPTQLAQQAPYPSYGDEFAQQGLSQHLYLCWPCCYQKQFVSHFNIYSVHFCKKLKLDFESQHVKGI